MDRVEEELKNEVGLTSGKLGQRIGWTGEATLGMNA
jgi:hypothetical protein